MALRTLQDSPVLEPLARAAEQCGVDAVLFGSVASRALLFDAADTPAKDLFELAEHVSDIDIGHTGPSSLTPAFAEAIASTMPLAPWFRWSIVDRDGLAEKENLARFNVGVPLRQLQLSTRHLLDPDGTAKLLQRALQGDIDLLPNARFDASPRSSFDSEASAVLVYVDAAFDVIQTDVRRSPKTLGGPGQRSPAADLVKSGVLRTLRMDGPGRDVALRRLWYRLAGSTQRVSPNILLAAVEHFGLEPIVHLLDEAGYPASRLVEAQEITIVSAYLGEGEFRMPLLVERQDEFQDWTSALEKSLAGMARPTGFDRFADPITLAPGNEVIGGVRSIPVSKGSSSSSRSVGPLAQEFVHLSLNVPSALGTLKATNLTAVVVGQSAENSLLLPAFASVSTALPWPYGHGFHDSSIATRCTIRINLPELGGDLTKLDVFLLHGDRR